MDSYAAAQLTDEPWPANAERCIRCRGKGLRYFGRGKPPIGCNACKGFGYKIYAQPAEKRAHIRDMAKARKAKNLQAAINQFAIDYPPIYAWMNTSTFPFAQAMLAALLKYGGLTEKQMAASQKCVRRDT